MSSYMYMLLDMDMSNGMELLAPRSSTSATGRHRQRTRCPTDERTIAMRYPHDNHSAHDRASHDHEAREHETGGRGSHDHDSRGGFGHGFDHAFGHRDGHGPREWHGRRDAHRHGRCGRHGGEQPRGGIQSSGRQSSGTGRRPTLERSIAKAARRIRRADLTPEQLHRRIAASVSHADYITTMRTLRRIGMELRPERPRSAR